MYSRNHGSTYLQGYDHTMPSQVHLQKCSPTYTQDPELQVASAVAYRQHVAWRLQSLYGQLNILPTKGCRRLRLSRWKCRRLTQKTISNIARCFTQCKSFTLPDLQSLPASVSVSLHNPGLINTAGSWIGWHLHDIRALEGSNFEVHLKDDACLSSVKLSQTCCSRK